jgi:hypothetical protein
VARSCIFCGRKPVTESHIFRRGWVEQVFPGAEELRHQHVRRETETIKGFDNKWAKDEADFKVNRTCQQCNGGWMDRLDHEAEDLFATKAAAWGAGFRLGTAADKLLASRWCVLIAMLSDQIQARPVVSAAAHRALYDGGMPRQMPRQTWVWLLRTEPPEWQVTGWGSPSELRDAATDEPHAYLAAFGIKHLVAQVYIAADPMPEMGIDSSGNAAILRQLWPDTFMPFIYPPPMNVIWDAARSINDRFLSGPSDDP